MRLFTKLFMKEIRRLRTFFIVLFLTHIVLNVSVMYVSVSIDEVFLRLLEVIIILVFLAFPFMLELSYRDERNTKSNYLLLSLPAHRFSVILSKYIAVFSLSLVFYGISELLSKILIHIHTVQHYGLIRQFQSSGIEHSTIFFLNLRTLFNYTFLLLGLVILLESIRYTFKRYPELICAVAGILCFVFYSWVWSVISVPMGLLNVYNIVWGLFFLLIGLFLFHKYGEV